MCKTHTVHCKIFLTEMKEYLYQWRERGSSIHRTENMLCVSSSKFTYTLNAMAFKLQGV